MNKEKPEYRRFKTHGPIHLILQEKVFRGVVATGHMEYIPEKDCFVGECEAVNEVEETQGEGANGVEHGATDLGSDGNGSPAPNPTPSSIPRSNRVFKRKKSSSCTKATIWDVNQNMMELIDIMKQESIRSIQDSGGDANILDYDSAIKLLLKLPWIDSSSDIFANLIILLENPIKRVAFSKLVQIGEVAVKNWVAAAKK